MITRLLVANRGEIARRVARTAHRLGIATVGLYTAPDRNAWHADSVDLAVAIGSYLDAAAIVEAACRTGADAVHPGYGFLAENAEFAEAVLGAGLVWAGPPPEQIRLLGDKVAAKWAAIEAGVPTTPVVTVTNGSWDAPLPVFPLLVKAAAGGGGRGMRVVATESDLDAAIVADAGDLLVALEPG